MVQIPSPCFVLEEKKLENNLKLIRKVADESGAEIILAFKGFAMWSAFDLIREYVAGATASSMHELMLCKEYMKCKAHTYAPAYAPDEIQHILDGSSHITFNSLSQLNQYKALALKNDVSIGLRVNPEWSDVETELYNPANSTSRLGMNSDQLIKLSENVDGLHFHVLCESDSYALENVLENLENRFGHLLHDVKWVNMGGGHLMTREGYDLEHLIALLKNFSEKHNVKVILEPGSAFAWQTGYLKTTVLDIVERSGIKTAIIDASFTCHMPDCLEMPYRPSIIGAHVDASASEFQYRIGGVSCLAGDYLEEYGFDYKLKIGDTLIFEDMMHYTMVKTTTFNGVKHPSIGTVNADGNFKLVKSFGYEDFKNRLS